jgi:hypothetical protein
MKSSSKIFVLILLLSLLPIRVSAVYPYSVEIDHVSLVDYVIDGDTFETITGYDIRLADIDAPEDGEWGYHTSRRYLDDLILDKIVYLDIDNITVTDPYGRLICLVYIRENSTHFLNVNKALVTGGYADVWNFTDNEFDPACWSLYVKVEESYLLDFQSIFEMNSVNTIYPSDSESKPLGCRGAKETDWLASAFVTSNLENYNEGLDIEDSFIDQVSDEPLGEVGSGIICFGGPLVSVPVMFYELNKHAPVVYCGVNGSRGVGEPWSQWYFANGTSITETAIGTDNSTDLFLMEVFKDDENRYVLLSYGIGWKGTYAAVKYFETMIYPNLSSYTDEWIIVKWEDSNGNGFVNREIDGDAYTILARG